MVVVGSLNYDLVVPVERFPLPGETVLGGQYYGNPGGKGGNQAVAAARLGQSVSMVGRVGDDFFGQQLRAGLESNGVDTSPLTVTPEAPSGVAFIEVDTSAENSIVVSPGANQLLSEHDVAQASDLLAAAKVTLLQLEVPVATVLAAARLAGGTVVLNPAPARPLVHELLAQVDVLVPNEGELATLAGGERPRSIEAIGKMAEWLLGLGPSTVVVTLGERGALVVTEGASVHVPSVDAEIIDTTGAGDCFCGALADGISRGADLVEATQWAVRAAGLAVGRSGAQQAMPWRSELEPAAST